MRAFPVHNSYRLLFFIITGLLLLLFIGPGPQAISAQGPAASGGAMACVGGFAGEYPCENVDFLSFLPIGALGGGSETKAANLWGWTDPLTGREYVILGLTDATAFVEVTDPVNPIYLGSLPTHTTTSTYRDMKVYQNYAFIIADLPSQHGMQVFDLSKLRDVTAPPVTFESDAHYDGFGNAHNIYINQESGYAYIMRITDPAQCGGAVTMMNIQDPLNPAFAGCYNEDGLASDAICVNYHGPDPAYQGREVCVVASDDSIIIGDVTDKNAPAHLARLTYPNIARAHNAWLTADHRYFLSADMNDEQQHGLDTRIFVWDFSDVDAPELIGIYNGPTPASDHNVWIKGQHAYVGNFRAGLRILDITGISSGTVAQAAYFDMIPEDNNVGHVGGAWAIYPYFESGVIAVSDKEAGLYLLRHTAEPTALTLNHLGTRPPTPPTFWISVLLASFIAALAGWK